MGGREAGNGHLAGEDAAGAAEGDEGGAAAGAAEAEIRGQGVGDAAVQRDVFEDLALGRDHGDAAAAERVEAVGEDGDGVEVAGFVHGHGVEAAAAGDGGGEQVAAVEAPRVGTDLAGAVELPVDDPAVVGLGHVDAVAAGGEQDAVGGGAVGDSEHWGAGAGGEVVDAGDVAGGAVGERLELAPIGEPEAAGGVEDQIVGAAEAGAEGLDRAGGQGDALEVAAVVGGRGGAGDVQCPRVAVLRYRYGEEVHAAVVANVEVAVGAEGGAVGGSAEGEGRVGEVASGSGIGAEAAQVAALDLDRGEAAVGQVDRAFGVGQ